MELKDFASLPEQLQVILVSGYLGYSIAQAGYRDNERKEDVFYGILSFGIFGYIFYDFTRSGHSSFLWPGIGALAASVLVALFWRKYGKRWFNKVLHKAAISNEDGIKTTWAKIIQDTSIAPTQIVVQMKDGSKYACDDVQAFGDAPIPLYYTDTEGSLAIYVTQRTAIDGVETTVDAVRHESWGARITYIPSKDIANIDIRFVKL
jgi:hypothetical protein